MKSYLHNQDIDILFKYKSETQEIQGISFIKGKYSFKGSAIDRSFSYAKIDRQIKNNNSPAQKEVIKQELQKLSSTERIKQHSIASNFANYLNSMGVINSQHNKLLKWKDEDKEEEDIQKLLNNYRRRR